MADGSVIGTYQVLTYRRERQHTDIEWEAGYGDVAGDMVPGVSEWQAEEEDHGYDSRGEDVRGYPGAEREDWIV